MTRPIAYLAAGYLGVVSLGALGALSQQETSARHARGAATLPTSLESCADLESLAGDGIVLLFDRPAPLSGDRWTPGVIHLERDGSDEVRFEVREESIELVVRCWEDAYRTGRLDQRYTSLMIDLMSAFPVTVRVLDAMFSMTANVLPLSPRYGAPAGVLLALRSMGQVADQGGDGSARNDVWTEVSVRRDRLVPVVHSAMRDQWWRCWDEVSRNYGVNQATLICKPYAEVVSRWLFGKTIEAFAGSDEVGRELSRREAALAQMLGMSDSRKRQIGVLASADDSELGYASTRLILRAFRDTDAQVRLMAVRLADAVRLDADGQSETEELRTALSRLAGGDADAQVRSEALAILARM